MIENWFFKRGSMHIYGFNKKRSKFFFNFFKRFYILLIKYTTIYLVHGLNQVVDEVFTVTRVTTFNEVTELTSLPHVVGVRQLEGPQKVVGLLKVGADSGDFVDEIFNTDDTVLAEGLFDDSVVVDGDTLLVRLGISTLVDQFTDGFQVGGTVGNVGLDQLEHFRGSLVQTDKDTVVDLQKTQQLENLTGLGGNVVDTTDTDNKDQLFLSGNVVVTVGLGLATEGNFLTLGSLVFGVVLGTTVEDITSLGELGLNIIIKGLECYIIYICIY